MSRGCAGASSSGYSLMELMLVLGIVATVSGAAAPGLLATIDDSRTLGAARYLSAKLQRVRMEAVLRSSNAGLRFSTGAAGYAYAVYADGNGNGVRSADISLGVDPELLPLERLPDLFRGVDFGVLPGLPAVEPSSPPPGNDPIKIGSSDILSFTPLGTSTSGSLYIRGARGSQYVIRVFGDSAKTRLLKFDSRAGRWSPL